MNYNERYFCANCNRFVKPFELLTCYDSNGLHSWKHKDCRKVILDKLRKETDDLLRKPVRRINLED